MPPCITADIESPGFNKTGSLYLIRILNGTDEMETTTVAVKDYDQAGAMQFIICTIFTYSFLGVFFLLVTRFRQGTTAHQSARTESDAINNYLKSERTLKLEGCKLKMISEIEKHAEDIKKYEEKLKLLEIQKDIREKDFGLPLEVKRKHSIFKTGLKKHKKAGSRMPPGKRRLSMPAAFGRMGFSFLFMESAEETLKEENEEFIENPNSNDEEPAIELTEIKTKQSKPEETSAEIEYIDDS